MFSYLHLADTTRLMGLGYPLPYLYLALPFLYLFTLAPAPCFYGPPGDLFTSNKLPSNKSLATAGTLRTDPQLLLGILAGGFVLLQSNIASMVYLSVGLIYAALAHRPL